MKKTSIFGRVTSIIAAGALASCMMVPMAFATNGVQSGTQDYGAPSGSSTYAWDPATNTNDAGGAGQIQLVYSTEGGSWYEPGASTTSADDNVAHDNGTYLLTIPKLISYTEMNIGAVSTSDDYTVNVRGALDAGKVVNVSATASGSLTNTSQAASDASAITFTTTQGKTTWTANEAYGTVNTDGSLSGTDGTDTIALSGTVKSAGTWKGVVTYSAAMETPAAQQGGGE